MPAFGQGDIVKRVEDGGEEAGPDPIDITVGARIKARRLSMGMSQERLGESLGLTFQQIQKYERASNRVSASRLLHIAKALDVSINWLFGDWAMAPPKLAGGFAEDGQQAFGEDAEPNLNGNEAAGVLRAYYGIPTEAARKSVFELMKSLAETDSPGPGPRS